MAYFLQRQGVLYCRCLRYKPEVWGDHSFLQELGFKLQWKHTIQANTRCVVHSLSDFCLESSLLVLELLHAVEQLLPSNPVSAALQ